MNKSSGKKGIYVHPNSFQFFTDDVNTHRQTISIYNPYEKTIKYKVLSTAPKRYLVDEPEGFIKSKSLIELTIRHHNSSFSDNSKDKLRIQIYELSTNNNVSSNMIFKRDLPLDSIVSRADFLASSYRESEGASDLGEYSSTFAHGNNLNSMLGFTNSIHVPKARTSLEQNRKNTVVNNENTESSVNYLIIFIGLICLTLIFLPSAGSTESSIPVYMHMTFEAKLFASFVLGMVTMVILKS